MYLCSFIVNVSLVINVRSKLLVMLCYKCRSIRSLDSDLVLSQTSTLLKTREILRKHLAKHQSI